MSLADDIRATMEAMRTQPMRQDIRIVHPNTYAHRKACPLWTNTPNAAHVHDSRCWMDR